MSYLRFNPFNQVHKGLRAMLYHNALQLQQTDFSNFVQASETALSLREVIQFFEEHADIEDSMVFPLLQKIAPDVVSDFESQHVKDHALGLELQIALEKIENARDDKERELAGIQVSLAFTEFIAFNLSHMNQEETIIKELFWQNFTDEQLIKLTKNIGDSIPNDKKARSAYWFMKGLSLNEIIDWLKDVQKSAPAFVLDQLLNIATTALTTSKINMLKDSLNMHAITE